MPREYGGHSQLGQSLNKSSQRTDHINLRRVNTRRGVIKESYRGTYYFYMTLLDESDRAIGTTNPIPVSGSSDDLAARYGSPEEMEGQWEVLITYRGPSADNGTAKVIGKFGNIVGGVTEEALQSNELNVKGTAFAPPGSGMI